MSNYEPTVWQNDPPSTMTPINAERLNKIEQGIVGATPKPTLDMYDSIPSGGALHVYDTSRRITAFNVNPITSQFWRTLWGGKSTFEYLDRNDGRGELRVTQPSVRTPLTWDTLGSSVRDMTVVTLMQFGSTNSYDNGTGPCVRVQGGPSDRNMIFAGFTMSGVNKQTLEIVVGEFVNDNYSQLGRVTILTGTTSNAGANQEWLIKLEVIGNRVRAKMWRASNTEPDSWDVIATTSLTSGGRSGLYSYGHPIRFRALDGTFE